MKPRFYVDQKITLLINRYCTYEADCNGNKSSIIGFVEQKRARLKEQINFFNDESKQNTLFSLRSEKVLDIHGKYFIEDTNGNLIGY